MLGGRCSVHPRSVERTRTHSATAASSFEMTVVYGSRLGTAPPQYQLNNNYTMVILALIGPLILRLGV